ncbi:MAG TPA: thiamine-phosphate kinase [Mycobacteriales bacterium]|nr:thiamine-phosphate kinase [Mycobacteriales bacterium]
MIYISVNDSGEFGLIARIAARISAAEPVLLGPGDDAAVVAAPDGRVVATTDLLVDGRHFRRDWSTAYDVGRKAAAQNLADIAAMGAVPTALLVGLAAPPDLALNWADGLADGLRDEAALVGAGVAGGDVVASDRVTIAVTALGDLAGRSPVTRSGARAGDVVVLAGRVGWAAAGLALLEAGRSDHPMADAHRRPDVDYAAARALAAAGATSMIDVSDGLLADLGHVAAASGVRIEVASAALPVSPEVRAAAEELGVDPLGWVAGGGDDHAFAATLPAEAVSAYPVIGRVTDVPAGESAGAVITDRDWLASPGHEHFR